MYVSCQIWLYSPSDPVLNFRGPRIFYLAVTIVVQLYCNVSIIHCKWKQYRKDTRAISVTILPIRPIRILLNDVPIQDSVNERTIPQLVQNSNSPINNTSYNKILAEVEHIVCFFVYVLAFLLIRAYVDHFITDWDRSSITKQSRILLYILDFGPKFLLSFMFPLMFYFSHKELRTYWKNSLNLCRKSKI